MEVKYLEYDPVTGKFSRLPRPLESFSSEKDFKMWNTRFANSDPCHKRDKGYLGVTLNNKHYAAHRVAWFIVHGYWPDQIDHINQDKTDNRLENLREVNNETNCRNQSRRVNNKSGVIGVYFDNQHKKWRASISHKGKNIHIGLSKDFDEVVKLRKEAEIKYGYHENHGSEKCM